MERRIRSNGCSVDGVVLLGVAFLVHLLAGHRLPRSHTTALLGIFTLTPVVAYLLAKPSMTWEIVQIGLFYMSCALVYIIAYSLIEEESPSLWIVTYVEKTPNGCAGEELHVLFARKAPLEKRLAAMVDSGLLARNTSGYTLTRKGYRVALLFAQAARVIGLKQGG